MPIPNLSELTAEWWKWLYSIPESSNPKNDFYGEDNNQLEGQPYKGSKLLFLASARDADLTITVPAGSAFFFPVLVGGWDNGDTPPTSPDYYSLAEMYDIVGGAMDAAEGLHATLDGGLLEMRRLQSPPFACKLPRGNIAALDIPVLAPAVSDGFWVYIQPLPKGTYELRFGGEIPNYNHPVLSFKVDVKYTIKVQ